MSIRPARSVLWAVTAVVLLWAANLFLGSVRIPFAEVWAVLTGGEASQPSWGYIVLESRLPQAVVALLSGAALAVSGLMLQTVFSNPLAGPSVLGIDSGASLGVALVMLSLGGTVGGGLALTGYLAVVAGAFAGAASILGIIIIFSTLVRSNVMLLIIGIMVGYLTSSLISLLNFFATDEGIRSYVLWGMGDFSSVSLGQLPVFCSMLGIGLLLAALLVKPLNALLLGERYAENLGVRVKRVRLLLLVSTGLLTAVVTAFCGPIGFIGLAMPHVARMLFHEADHRVLLPGTLLSGAAVLLLCDIVSKMFTLPVNAITALLGIPIVVWVVLRNKSMTV